MAEPVTASQATALTWCSFCRRKGHDLKTCRSAAKTLKQSKGDSRAPDTSSSGQSLHQGGLSRYDDHKASSDRCTKASYVVPLDSSDKSDTAATKASTTRVTLLADDDAQESFQALACKSQDWLADTGCSHTMAPNKDDILHAQPRRVSVRLADQSVIMSKHHGIAALPFQVNSPPEALLVPDLEEPLLSISSVCDVGCEVLFTPTHIKIYCSGALSTPADPITTGSHWGNLYYIPNDVRSFSASLASTKTHALSLFDWHCRLGHIGLKPLRHLLPSQNISLKSNDEIYVQQCVTCVKCKMHRKSFKDRDAYRAKSPGDLIHSDVGSFEVTS